MAKIQRLKISTDEKMSMLRGQPGHMPAAPVAVPAAEAAAPSTPAVEAPAPPPVAVVVTKPKPVAKPAPVVAAVPAAGKRGRGRPPKPVAEESVASGLQPSLIRLEGDTQKAALAYIHEELMLHNRRVYLKELVDEAVNYYLQHGPPAKK